MSEAAIETVSGRGSVRALSALAGLAPLTVAGVVNGVFAVMDRTFGITASSDLEARMAFMNAQSVVALVAVVLVALATGWILYRSGSVRWGVMALAVIGLIDVWGRVLNDFDRFRSAGESLSSVQVTALFFAFGAPALLLAAMVLLGAWLCRLRGAR